MGLFPGGPRRSVFPAGCREKVLIINDGDRGSATNHVYILSAGIDREEDSPATGLWTRTRKAVCNGEAVELREQKDAPSSDLLENLLQGCWYKVRYNADGTAGCASGLGSDGFCGFIGAVFEGDAASSVLIYDKSSAAAG